MKDYPSEPEFINLALNRTQLLKTAADTLFSVVHEEANYHMWRGQWTRKLKVALGAEILSPTIARNWTLQHLNELRSGLWAPNEIPARLMLWLWSCERNSEWEFSHSMPELETYRKCTVTHGYCLSTLKTKLVIISYSAIENKYVLQRGK